ncbi:MAG: hypothetical protein ABSE73_20660 [Planctomycetota bacterium]
MTEEEARKLLKLHVDGLLRPDKARQVETVLAASPNLQAEFRKLKEENELLAEALAPLRPTRSARMRVVEAMQLAAGDVHRRVQHVADTLPERGWRIFRLGFASGAVLSAALLGHFHPPPLLLPDEARLAYYVSLGLFAIGIILLVAGKPLAQLEARLVSMVSQRTLDPTRLETLMLEVFGILSILAAGILYLWQ